MKILGIDTSTRTMSIGLIDGNKILGEISFDSNMDHSEKLIENISYLLGSNNLRVADLDGIAVAVGPGSFTGVRIGISTVKGLVEFKDIPVAAVSSLEALSRNFSSSEIVAVAVDAKRDRVYGGIYNYGGEEREILIKESLYDIDEFIGILENFDSFILAGDILDRFSEVFGDRIRYGKEKNLLNQGSNLCFIGKKIFEDDKGISHLDLMANYMTKSQAQIDFDRRNNVEKD